MNRQIFLVEQVALFLSQPKLETSQATGVSN